MTLRAEVLRALLAAGATAEMIVAAVEADASIEEAKVAEKRAKDAARQRKSRENRGLSRPVTVTPCDTTDGQNEPPPKTPAPPNTPPIIPPSPPAGAQTPKGVPGHRGSALPADWAPKETHLDKVRAADLPEEFAWTQAEAMREWAEANRNRPIARKACWDQTFHGWLRKAIADEQRRRAKSATGPPSLYPVANAYDPAAMDRLRERLLKREAGGQR